MWSLAWLACKDPPPSDKQVAEHTATPGPTGDSATDDTGTRPGPDLVATEAADWTLSQTWTIPEVEVRAGATSVLLSWSGLTVDAWGDPIVASAVPRLMLLEITVPPSEVADRLAKDDLGFDLLSTWEADVSGRVFAQADELTSGISTFDPAAFFLEDPNRSWVLAVADLVDGVPRIRSAAIIVPETSSGVSSVMIGDGGASFTWAAALDGEPIVTADEWDAWTLDWEQVETDGFGRPFDDRRIDELFIARYADSPATLGGAGRDLPGAAEAVWRMEVGSFTDARLELARDAGGGSFPGFTAGDTWVVGLRCAACWTPFPAFAAVVEVR